MSRDIDGAETGRRPSIADGAWRRELLFRLAEIDGVSSTPVSPASLAEAKRRELDSFTAQDQVRADLATLEKPETRVAILTALGRAIHRCRRSYVADNIVGYAAICVVTGISTYHLVAHLLTLDPISPPVSTLATLSPRLTPVGPDLLPDAPLASHSPLRPTALVEMRKEIAVPPPPFTMQSLTSVVGENGEFFVPVSLPVDPPAAGGNDQDVVISGIPEGIFATAGDAVGAGVVVLPASDLAMLRFVTNAVSPLAFTLDFAFRDKAGAITTQSRSQINLQRPEPAGLSATVPLVAAETPKRTGDEATVATLQPPAAAASPKRRVAVVRKPAAAEKPTAARVASTRNSESEDSDKRERAAALIRSKRMAVGRPAADTAPSPAQGPAEKPWWQKPAPDWAPSIVPER